MTNSITVLSNSAILQENRQDPITGDLIKEGDKVVICASCKSAFLEGSWNYLGKQHCQQRETLNQIPAKQNFKFVKKLKQLEQVIFSAESYQGNTALIIAVPTGIISFIISILLILNVTNLLWLWGVVAGLTSIPFIFNAFQTKGIEVKEKAIYIKKGFGLKKKIAISDIRQIDFLLYNNLRHSYDKRIDGEVREVVTYISIPPTLYIRERFTRKKIQISEYDFNKKNDSFLTFFNRINQVLPIVLLTNEDRIADLFTQHIPNLTIKRDLEGLRYIYGGFYYTIPLD